MSLEESQNRWKAKLQKVAHETDGNPVIDARTVEDLVDEILAEGFRVGQLSARGDSIGRRRRFRFDVPLLQCRAKAKKEKGGLEWLQVSNATGIVAGPLKQHLGDNPPKDMGLHVAVALLAWLGDFDLLGYLLED